MPILTEVQRGLRWKACRRHPDKVLTIGIVEGQYVPQCNECLRSGNIAVIGDAAGRVLERSRKLIETNLAQRQTTLAALDPREIRTLLPVGKATDQEVMQFVKYAQHVGADPWAKEIYLIKYSEKDPAAIALALNWYLKKASHNPAYESYESGVIVEHNGEYIDVVGSVVYPGYQLFGGWCRVHKHGARVPFERRVTMAEYDRHQFGWKTMPATMIEKVAIVQGIRRAFPDEFAAEGEAPMPMVLEGEFEVPAPERPTITQHALGVHQDDQHATSEPEPVVQGTEDVLRRFYRWTEGFSLTPAQIAKSCGYPSVGRFEADFSASAQVRQEVTGSIMQAQAAQQAPSEPDPVAATAETLEALQGEMETGE